MNRRAIVLAVLLAAVAVPASAAMVTCPPAPDVLVNRVFTLTTSPLAGTCLASGTGNISGAPGNDYIIDSLFWTAIDKDQPIDTIYPHDAWFSVTGLSATSGIFTISADAWAAFGSLAIGFKVGGAGDISPDWAVFVLPQGYLTGSWSVSVPLGQSNQGLSHANLYGTAPIPEPATLILLGTGLLGLAARARRRHKR